MSRVRVYISGNKVHDQVLRAFFEGCDATKEYVTDWKYEASEIAVIFGVGKSKVPISWPRGEIFRQQRNNNCDVVVLETGYINRGDGETHHYAAGLNGLNGRANFKNRNSPADRLEALKVEVKPWKDGEQILLCGQVPWDASVDHHDHVKWLWDIAKKIRKNTDRPVVFRPHPLVTLPPIPDCDYSTDNFKHDLYGAHACVTFNSNSAVEAALEGIPVFAFDEGSMALPIANRDVAYINSPAKPDRTQWLRDLAYCQWTPEEMRNGLCWKHLYQ